MRKLFIHAIIIPEANKRPAIQVASNWPIYRFFKSNFYTELGIPTN